MLADIYSVSLDPSLWTPVLETVCAFVPGAVSSVLIQERVAKRIKVGYNDSLEPTWNELYLTKYLKINLMFPALLFCEAGEIFYTCDLIPATQMAQTRFYRELGWENPSVPYW